MSGPGPVRAVDVGRLIFPDISWRFGQKMLAGGCGAAIVCGVKHALSGWRSSAGVRGSQVLRSIPTAIGLVVLVAIYAASVRLVDLLGAVSL